MSVHPHGRGDNRLLRRARSAICGSPPRAWGQSLRLPPRRRRRRFTPTGVGTIIPIPIPRARHPVHPHGRGDNRDCPRECLGRRGSPPRAWGQLERYKCDIVYCRFTPTGVGTIPHRPAFRLYWAVHPHGRGDNTGPLIRTEARNGSPPRAWGQSSEDAVPIAPPRFTPTGVGTILASQAF